MDDLDEVSPGLDWVEINDVTLKLVGEVEELIPRSHGQWGGYKTRKALAYVILLIVNDKDRHAMANVTNDDGDHITLYGGMATNAFGDTWRLEDRS